MATVTLGTVSSTGLQALQFQAGGLSATDVATIAQSIKNDAVAPARPVQPGAFESGKVTLTGGRGIVSLLPGDWIAVDSVSGFVCIIPGTILPSTLSVTGVTQSGSSIVTALSVNTSSTGWMAGMALSGSNFSAGTIIQNIIPGGSSIVLNLGVAASSAAATITAGGPFTHG